MKDSIIKTIEGSKVTVTDLKGMTKEFDISGLLGINQDNLTSEFANQASLYAFFATLLAKAEGQTNITELAKDSEYAAADLDIRDDMEKNGRKTTEAQIRALVLCGEDYQKLAESEIAFKMDQKIIKAITDALNMRAEMLISLGAHLRHELSMTGMNIKEKQFDDVVNQAKNAMKLKNNI